MFSFTAQPPVPDDERGLRASTEVVEAALRALLDDDDPMHPDNDDGRRGLLWYQAATWAIQAKLAERHDRPG